MNPAIFDALSGLKKTSVISAQTEENFLNLVKNMLQSGENPTEMYVAIDFMRATLDKAQKLIKQATINHIIDSNDNVAFGRELSLVKVKDYKYEEDKRWNDIENQLNIIKTSQKNYEAVLQNKVKEAIQNGTKPPINYDENTIIKPGKLK